MAKAKKRRVKKTRPHQVLKQGEESRNINWTRIILIGIGIFITVSMILSLVITPGTGLGG